VQNALKHLHFVLRRPDRQTAKAVEPVPIMTELIMAQTLTAEKEDEGVTVTP
jgi:hypothetical protein